MNVTEAIRKRRSVRKYQEGANIPQEDLDQILEAAMMAPSARNTRPWEFVVVENREVLNKFPDIQPYTRMMHTASLAIVVCGRPDLQQDGNIFWPQDCGAAIENMLLQALELGYGTCWCGLYPAEERVRGFQELLDVESIDVVRLEKRRSATTNMDIYIPIPEKAETVEEDGWNDMGEAGDSIIQYGGTVYTLNKEYEITRKGLRRWKKEGGKVRACYCPSGRLLEDVLTDDFGDVTALA